MKEIKSVFESLHENVLTPQLPRLVDNNSSSKAEQKRRHQNPINSRTSLKRRYISYGMMKRKHTYISPCQVSARKNRLKTLEVNFGCFLLGL